jgi:hypothetical protein
MRNDIVVTTKSAQYPGYRNLNDGPFPRNHSTIGKEDIGNAVIHALWVSEIHHWR